MFILFNMATACIQIQHKYYLYIKLKKKKNVKVIDANLRRAPEFGIWADFVTLPILFINWR